MNSKQSFEYIIKDLRRRISLTGLSDITDILQVKKLFNRHLHCTQLKDRNVASNRDYLFAIGHTVRDQLVRRWIRTQQFHHECDSKRIYYISLEFYMGRSLVNTMVNLDIKNVCNQALYQMGLDLEELESLEEDAGLGNGGRGRLAACLLDSMATLGLPSYGYGLRYEYGLFAQRIVDGEQVEEPDDWLKYGNLWEKDRPECIRPVQFGGKVILSDDAKYEWLDTDVFYGIPYDSPVPGYKNNLVNTMRLWTAKPPKSFNLRFFNNGDYINAVLDRNKAEDISRVLHPNDTAFVGKVLRLKQEYFVVSASIQDIVHRYGRTLFGHPDTLTRTSFDEFCDKVAIHLNDFNLGLAIPELMRIFLDVENMFWNKAWDLTMKVFSCTCHSVDLEAFEYWPVDVIEDILPRLLPIIHQINQWFLSKVVDKFPGDSDRQKRMSVFKDCDVKRVNMAHLVIVGCHAINSVSEIHFELLKNDLFKDFYEMWPERFKSITNGITPRRWLLVCNPELAELITLYLKSSKWTKDLSLLKQLEKLADNKQFREEIYSLKQENKLKLANHLADKYNIEINLNSMFDIQVKRIRLCKRQLLNCLHIIVMYNRIKSDCCRPFVPRTVMLGGKAAPGNFVGKQIIQLVCSIGEIVNKDPDVGHKLKVIFLENYGVSYAEKIIPAADLSEQLAVPGSNSSGTGVMKFMLNGALIIGALTGVAMEIKREVGDENIFIFGMDTQQVKETKKRGYNARDYYNKCPELKYAIDQISSGYFNPKEPNKFCSLVSYLLNNDSDLILADFESYVAKQDEISQLFLNKKRWTTKSILNIASSGKFSIDRAVAQYAEEMWGMELMTDVLPPPHEQRLTSLLA